METFFALLALCTGNSPVTGEFPVQRPVTRSFDDFFDLCLNKRLSKQSSDWWVETPSTHYDVTVMLLITVAHTWVMTYQITGNTTICMKAYSNQHNNNKASYCWSFVMWIPLKKDLLWWDRFHIMKLCYNRDRYNTYISCSDLIKSFYLHMQIYRT